jgi:hypothetical protein
MAAELINQPACGWTSELDSRPQGQLPCGQITTGLLQFVCTGLIGVQTLTAEQNESMVAPQLVV